MKRFNVPEKLTIPPTSINFLQDTGSSVCLSARKRKNTFMTQMSKRLTAEEVVLQSHNELIQYIDKLEDKVQKIIESHDSQFLLAYRTHLCRVREEMQQLKNKNASNAHSASSQGQKIQSLQKELIIFRQESLKLFQKLTEKDKLIQFLNMKVNQFQTEQKFNKKTITDLMKRNKYLQGFVKDLRANNHKQEINKIDQKTKKKSLSILEVNSTRKYPSKQKRPNNMGWTGQSYYYQNMSNNESQKNSRQVTTTPGSKRNSIVLINSKINSKLQNILNPNNQSHFD